MRVLCACEESQAVTIEMRRLGHEAYSCDLQDCSGGHPEWHIKGDVLRLINGNCRFQTMDGEWHEIVGKWDIRVLNKIDEAPAVDAVPVVHARWEYNPGDNIPYCSNCAMPQDVPTNYCHGCGAKMDAKEEE